MSRSDQALWFNAVPLLVVAAAFLVAGARLWGAALGRQGRSHLDSPLLALLGALGLAAAVFGSVLAVDRKSPPGGPWLTFALAAVLGLPALLALRASQRPAGPSGESEQEPGARPADAAPPRSDDVKAVAERLLGRAEELAGIELACLLVIDDDVRTGKGVVGRVNGSDLDWFSDVRIDLQNEPSGVATATFEAAPFAVYDAAASKIVSSRMVDATGAKSVAFIPLLLDEQVTAVLVAGSVSEHRAFTTEELGALQSIAGDAALALDRARSTAGLGEALERERFVARISARVRSELDIDALLRVAVEGRQVSRCRPTGV